MDQIIRDLVDAAIISTRAKMKRQMRHQIAQAVEDRILDTLLGSDSPSSTRVSRQCIPRSFWGQIGSCVGVNWCDYDMKVCK